MFSKKFVLILFLATAAQAQRQISVVTNFIECKADFSTDSQYSLIMNGDLKSYDGFAPRGTARVTIVRRDGMEVFSDTVNFEPWGFTDSDSWPRILNYSAKNIPGYDLKLDFETGKGTFGTQSGTSYDFNSRCKLDSVTTSCGVTCRNVGRGEKICSPGCKL